MAGRTTTTRQTSSSAHDRTRVYAEAVVAGEILAGPHVRNACRRHLLDLKEGGKRGLWFDHDALDSGSLRQEFRVAGERKAGVVDYGLVHRCGYHRIESARHAAVGGRFQASQHGGAVGGVRPPRNRGSGERYMKDRDLPAPRH